MEHNYIKEYRLLLNIKTQAKLARLADVPRSTLGEIERHKTIGDRETLGKIAKALGVTIETLYIPPKIER